MRLDPERAERHRLFDPVTISVSDRATLRAWDEYLTAKAIAPMAVPAQPVPVALADPQRNAGGFKDLLHDTGQVGTDSVEAGRGLQHSRQQTGHNRAYLDPAGAESKKNRTYGTLGRL
jgi:hypothetical protein